MFDNSPRDPGGIAPSRIITSTKPLSSLNSVQIVLQHLKKKCHKQRPSPNDAALKASDSDLGVVDPGSVSIIVVGNSVSLDHTGRLGS